MGRPKEMMVGFQADVSGLSGKDNWLEMYTGKTLLRVVCLGYSCGDNTHRIGSGGGHKIWMAKVWNSITML